MMRTGATTVPQTLRPEAAAVLKHAVTEACRRGHSQATPLHVAAALLGVQGSPLRRACIHTHPLSSHPLQCRALELCFNVALDRLPASQGPLPGGQPLYSNALVAALKRAQAHQRRGCPEQQQPPLLAVKVELEQLVISILDDPGVSRVMREAGYSSTDIKTHLEEIVDLMGSHRSMASSNSSLGAAADHIGLRLNTCPGILGNMALRNHLPQYTWTPLNQNDPQLHLRTLRTTLPANLRLQSADFPSSSSKDVTRLVEILLRRKNRNPVLIGESGPSSEALIRSLMHHIENCDVPEQLFGVKMITPQFSALAGPITTREEIELKFRELNKRVEELIPSGAIINVGDLQWLLKNSSPKASSGGVLTFCPVQHAISGVEQIISRHRANGRLWLIGTATCQSYVGCQALHPTLEDRWELQSVPITAAPLSLGLQPRCKSRESMANVVDASLTLTSNPAPLTLPLLSEEELNCCSECMSKYEQEVVLIHEQERQAQSESPQSCATSVETSSKEIDSERSSRLILPVQPTLPLWLQKALPAHSATETVQVKEKAVPLTQKLLDLRKKWNYTCQTLHSHQMPKHSVISEQRQQLSPSSSQTSGSSCRDTWISIHDNHNPSKLIKGCLTDHYHLHKHTGYIGNLLLPNSHQQQSPTPCRTQSAYRMNAIDAQSKQAQPVSCLEERLNRQCCRGPVAGSCGTVNDMSISVKTDLSLGRTNAAGVSISGFPSQISESHLQSVTEKERIQHPYIYSSSFQSLGCVEPVMPVTSGGLSLFTYEEKTNNLSGGMLWQVNSEAYKNLCKGLVDRVWWQQQIVSEITNTIILCRSGMRKRKGVSLKGDTWMLFLGPDQMGKQKMAQALAELIFGNEQKLINIRLGHQHTSSSPCPLNSGLQESNVNIESFERGKLPLDQLAEAVQLNPFSVVLLEGVDQCDSVTRNGLLRAIETGRLSSSTGGEVSFSNVIVIMTANVGMHCLVSKAPKAPMQFTEERLAAVSGSGIRLAIGNSRCDKVLLQPSSHLAIVIHDNKKEVGTEIEILSLASASKRKAIEDGPESKMASIKKKQKDEKAMSLDLNISVEDDEIINSSCCESMCEIDLGNRENAYKMISDHVLHHAREQMEKLYVLVDATLVFYPYDFDALRNTVIDVLSRMFLKVSGNFVEIDIAVLEHIMAAVWASNKNGALMEWTTEVLETSLLNLLSCCTLSGTSVVKLLSEEAGDDIRSSTLCLPNKISLDTSAEEKL